MAEAFPRSQFRGFDTHPASIDAARGHAAETRTTNATFEAARADDYPGKGYDLICFFDCLHDLGDPAAAIADASRGLGVRGGAA